MQIQRGQVVRSLAGHDRGTLLCVLEAEEDFLLLADGNRRKVAAPKRKRRKHVIFAGHYEHPTLAQLGQREPVLDSELRRALAAFRDEWSRR